MSRGPGFRVRIVVVAATMLASGCGTVSEGSPPAPVAAPSPSRPAVAAGPSPPASLQAEPSVASTNPGVGYREAPCQLPAPSGGRPAGYLKSCGTLRVPENRSRADSQVIELAVVVIGSANANPAPDPVLIVAHGAGGETILPSLDGPLVAALRRDRDVILTDSRGTGLSKPSLNCGEFDNAVIDGLTVARAEAARLQVQAVVDCRARLEARGTDLTGYTSREVAADMAALPAALGYAEWNLYGSSYSTREEQGVMRNHPEGIRSVILDAVLPTGGDALAAWGPNAAATFDLLVADCAADPACGSAQPDLGATFDRLVADLDARPRTLTFDDPWSGLTRTGRATGDTLIMGTFNALYRTSAIGGLPARIAAIGKGDATLLEESLALEAHSFAAEGAYFRVFCGDDFLWTDVATVHAAAASIKRARFGDPFSFWSEADLAMCDAFGAERIPAADRMPVVSAIPTLILSGEYDPITPAAWGDTVGAALERSTHVVFPGVGHGVVGSGACADRIANRFLADPTAAVDPACALALTLPRFGTDR